ncbi:hypothetical protein PR048_029324 [Dryococelus australis]|uniref:Alpha-amylase n=1 Tax=Dryococelus australis TaxID=614101 RepID=A0ABQ9GDF0_9NEOP|nr:hypothetical protein PR048_029324 [Dryococelus australis]
MIGVLLLCCVAGGWAANLPVPDSVKLDWWQTALIYQMYPLSFKDGNGDGYGDFKGDSQALCTVASIRAGHPDYHF